MAFYRAFPVSVAPGENPGRVKRDFESPFRLFCLYRRQVRSQEQGEQESAYLDSDTRNKLHLVPEETRPSQVKIRVEPFFSVVYAGLEQWLLGMALACANSSDLLFLYTEGGQRHRSSLAGISRRRVRW